MLYPVLNDFSNQIGLQRSVIVGAEPYGLGLDEKIMPEYLKELGYRTHIVGKVTYKCSIVLRNISELCKY